MDHLQKAYGQLVDAFKSMTPAARMAAVLLLVVAMVSALYLGHDQIIGSDAYLMDGEMFSASQLRSMHAALGKANLEAQIDGARIKVPRGQESKCMAALAEAGALPVEFGGYLEKALTSGGFMTLNRNQDAAMKIAKQRELQNIINTMVDKSLVIIDEQSDRGFPPKTIITASVSIQPRDREPLDENRIPAAIRNLVSSSVAGLKPEAVTVVDLSTQRTYPGNGGGEGRAPGALGEYTELKRYHEREYQEKISRLLAPYIPGVLVTASVELDPPANEPAPRESAAPRRVAVSVAVPHSYYERVWQQANPATAIQPAQKPDAAQLAEITAAEKQKIEALVGSLLPKRDPADASPAIIVSTFYQFSELPPREVLPAEQAWAWLSQHGQTVGLVALALVGLLAMRSLIRSTTARPEALTASSLVTAASLSLDDVDTTDRLMPDMAHDRLRRRAPLGPSLRGELADIVRDDPEAAVTVLRTWIGNAS